MDGSVRRRYRPETTWETGYVRKAAVDWSAVRWDEDDRALLRRVSTEEDMEGLWAQHKGRRNVRDFTGHSGWGHRDFLKKYGKRMTFQTWLTVSALKAGSSWISAP